MRVGVLGSGEVGQTLGSGFAEAGHDVVVGTREPDRPALAAWRDQVGRRIRLASFSDAARHGEWLVLAVGGGVAEAVVDLAGPAHLAGKLLLDVTNPLDFSRGMPPGLLFGMTDSVGERLQRKLPNTRVVKVFNTVPRTLMVHPRLAGGGARMLIAGNDAAAKAQTAEILAAFGWPGVIDVGGIEAARWLEALVPLWVRVGASMQNFDFCFGVATR